MGEDTAQASASGPRLGPKLPSRRRAVSLFTLKVIGFGLFIQISLQKCGNGTFFSIYFPENKTKCKRPRREPRTFLGSPNIQVSTPAPPGPSSWDGSLAVQPGCSLEASARL